MKRSRKQLRYTKTVARYFKKNNIREINFENNLPFFEVRFFEKPHEVIIKSHHKAVVTFNDGTQKEAKSYQSYPLKIEYKEKTNDN